MTKGGSRWACTPRRDRRCRPGASDGLAGVALTREARESAAHRRRGFLRAFRESGELSARDRLVADCLPLVASLAHRYANQGEQLDDLIQVGSVGLLKAIDRFDFDRGVKLTTTLPR